MCMKLDPGFLRHSAWLAFLLCCGAQAGELGELLNATLAHPQIQASTTQADAARVQEAAVTGRYFGAAAVSAGWHQYEGDRVVGVFVPGGLGTPLAAERISQAGVNYSLPVDLSGVIAAGRERAGRDLDAARLAARQQTLLKLHQAATAYVTLQALLRQKDALKPYRQRVDATFARVRREVELGKAAGVDARYAESELARLEADERLLDGAITQAQADLAESSGRDGFLPTAPMGQVPAWADAAPDGTLPAQLAQAREASARAQADEGRRGLYPSLSLDANWFRNSGGGDYRDTWQVGGVVSLPLGVTQYRQADALSLAARAAAEQSRAASREAGRQLSSLHAAYDSALADGAAMEREVAYRRQVVEVQSEMQRLGSQTLENLFSHERDLLDARYRLAQANARAAVAWSSAQVVIGMDAETYISRMDPK